MTSTPQYAPAGGEVRLLAAQRVLAVARISLGWVFLWAFLDKCFGLGFPTPSGQGWLFGTGSGNPTQGYLSGVDGPFAWLFNPMAGLGWVNWLFMAGLAGIGIGVMTGLAFRFSAVCACLMLFLIYLTALPPSANPFMDDHIIEIFLVLGLLFLRNGRVWGAQGWWDRVVGERVPLLK
jgi:thiosulfate dehydrogenase [quinone] large subunit